MKYLRQSLFFYTLYYKSPCYDYWRITVYVFSKPINKNKLHKALNEAIERHESMQIKEKSSYSYEEEEVISNEAKGIGYYWAIIYRGKDKHTHDEIERFNWSYYEKTNVRLGPSKYMGMLSAYNVYKQSRIPYIFLKVKSFWKWVTYGL